MSTVPDAHREAAGQRSLACAVLTCSDSRTPETDTSGALMRELLQAAGHRVELQEIVREDPGRVFSAIKSASESCEVILLNGGTGVSRRDGTIEAVSRFIDRELPGFGELFRMLSYQEIGPAAMLSRALAGSREHVVVFATPGSTAAVRLALERLIIPELRHVSALLSG